jgi:uncharacterized membrane protein
VVLLLCAALATDLGLQRVARSDMQAVADTVALDLARELDGRDAATLAPLMAALAAASRDRNADVVGDQATMAVELGELDDQGDFAPVVGTAVPTAVRVTASTEVDFAFGGITGVDDGSASRSAVGVSELGACFRVGSYVARLDSTTGPLLDVLLGTLLGSTVSLTVSDWNGLAAAEVTLLDLVEVGGLGVGTVEELLALDHLSLRELYLAMARVLTQDGQLAAAALLESLSVAAATPTIAVADLLTASASDQAALAARLGVLDLVTGAAYAAWVGHTLAIPSLGVSVPGVASVGASLYVTEAPQIGCGGAGTQARTAQVRLTVPVTVPGRTLTVAGVGAVTVGATTLSVEVDLGQALAELQDVVCGSGGAEALELRLSSAVVGRVALAGSTSVSLSVGVPLASSLLGTILSVLGLTVLPAGLPTVALDTTVAIGATTPGNTLGTDLTLSLPASYATPVGSASGVVLTGLDADAAVGAEVVLTVPQLIGPARTYRYSAGPLFTAIVDPVLAAVTTSVVSPVLSVLQTSVIAPLARLLGLQLAGADVWAIREPACGGPQLRG